MQQKSQRDTSEVVRAREQHGMRGILEEYRYVLWSCKYDICTRNVEPEACVLGAQRAAWSAAESRCVGLSSGMDMGEWLGASVRVAVGMNKDKALPTRVQDALQEAWD